MTDEGSKEKYMPMVIESSMGVDRTCLALLCDALGEETLGDGETRTVMRLHPAIAPVKVSVLPLSKKLSENARKVGASLRKHWNVFYDETGNIGRRYRRQDEIGTPFCVTYDFDSEEDQKVTVRERDSMEQDRVPIDALIGYLRDHLGLGQ